MRTPSFSFQQALEDNNTIFGTYTRITRRDGHILRLVDLDVDSPIGGELFLSAGGSGRTAVEVSAGLSADNFDLRGIYDSDLISEDELLAGAFNHSKVEIFLAVHGAPAIETYPLLEGFFGKISYDTGQFSIQVNSFLYALTHSVGAVTSPVCRDKLGGPRCRINLLYYTVETTFAEMISPREYRVSHTGNPTFDLGVLKVLSGVAMGGEAEIKTYVGDRVHLFMPMPIPPSPGDAISVTMGCPGTREVCKTRFNNLANMDAEPDLPGQDEFLNPTVRRA